MESPESEREKPRSGRIAERRNGGMDGAKRREKGESDVRFELAPPAHEPLVPPSLLKVTHTYIFYPSLYPCHGNDWSTQVQPITSNVTNAGPNQTYIHSKQSYPLRLPAA